MWIVINTAGDVVSVQENEPPDQPGHEKVEWYGQIEWVVDHVIEHPDGTQHPVLRGVDPRPVGYEAHRDKMTDLQTAASSELDYLDTTIPTIDTMTDVQVRDVVKRLAQENRQMIRAWQYVLNRLLNS